MDKIVLANDFGLQWQDIKISAASALERVGHSGWWILGREVEAFEEKLAAFSGLASAAGCASGLDALELSLRVLELSPGAKVLTTPLSAFATTLAIIRAGGSPVYVDVDSSGLIDLELVDQVLATHSDIRFLMPVHLFGHAINLRRLRELKNKYKIFIVEDCAQAIGAASGQDAVGTVGELAAVSFYPTKNLGALGDGGAVLSSSSDLISKVKILRDYGQSEKYLHSELGTNSRLDELQAAILNDAIFPRLEKYTQTRRAIADRYLSELKNPHLIIPPVPEGSHSVWHLFPILVDGDRDAFLAYLKSNKIAGGIHYPKLITDQPAMAKQLNFRSEFAQLTPLTKALNFSNQEVSLPIHPYLTPDEINRVITVCNRWAVA